jgi:hypothetical protein
MRDTRERAYPELQDTKAAAGHALAFAMLKSRKAEKNNMDIDPPSLSLRGFTFMLQHNVFLLGMLFCGINGDFREKFHRILPDTATSVDIGRGSIK